MIMLYFNIHPLFFFFSVSISLSSPVLFIWISHICRCSKFMWRVIFFLIFGSPSKLILFLLPFIAGPTFMPLQWPSGLHRSRKICFCHSDTISVLASAVLNKTLYFPKSTQPFKVGACQFHVKIKCSYLTKKNEFPFVINIYTYPPINIVDSSLF